MLSAIITLILTAVATASQPSLTPQTGVLILRNGQVLHGEITRAGDYYVVTLGPTSEVRLQASEVEIACRTLDEAYVHRLQRLDPTSQKQRIALAEWCLRNAMLDQAQEQLELAEGQGAEHPQLKSIRQRLEFARQPKPEFAPHRPTTNIATVGSEQLEKALRDLPDGSVEKFSAVIQPILLNRCGANQCHGPLAKSDYQLLRPAPGQVANQRFSQRNLYSTLRFINRDDPLGSPLLIMPQRRHGGASGPIFDERTRGQLEELSAWVAMTVAKPPPPAPPQKIDPNGALLSAGHRPQVAGKAADSTVTNPASETDASRAKTGVAEPVKPQEPKAGADAEGAYVPRDPFDPEIFNRRFSRRR